MAGSTKRSIEAGKGHVTLATEDSALQKGLADAKRRFEVWGKDIAKVGAVIAGMAAVITAPFLGGLSVLSNWAGEVKTAMRETGLGFEQVQMLADGLKVGLDELTPVMGKLSSFLHQAANGSHEANAALAELGLTISDLGNMNEEDRLLAIADAISKVGDANKRIALQREIFGRSGMNLNLEGGREGMRARRERAEELRGTQTPADFQAAKDYNRAVSEMKTASEGLWLSLGSVAAPIMREIIANVTEGIVIVRQWVNENRSLLTTLFRIGLIVGAAGSALLALAGGLAGAAVAVGYLASILAFLGGLLPALWGWYVWSDKIKYSVLGIVGAFRLFGVEVRQIWEPLGVLDDLFDSLVSTITEFASTAWDWIKESPLGEFATNAVDWFAKLWNSIEETWDSLVQFSNESGLTDILVMVGKIWLGFVAVNAVLLALGGYLAYVIAKFLTDTTALRALDWADGLKATFQAAKELLAFIFGPLIRIGESVSGSIGSMGSAIGRLGSYFSTAASEIASSFGEAWEVTRRGFGELFSSLISTAGAAWEGIKNAFAVGDWETLWAILKTAALLAWYQILDFVAPIWSAWKTALMDAFDVAWGALKTGFIILWGEVKAVAFETFAAIAREAAGLAHDLGLDRIRNSLEDQAHHMEVEASNARRDASLDAEIAAEKAERERRDRQMIADLEREMGGAAANPEIAALQEEFEGLNNYAAYQAYLNQSESIAPNAPGAGGDLGGRISATVSGTYFAAAVRGWLGSAGGVSPQERMQETLNQANLIAQQSLRELVRIQGAGVRN